MFNFIKFKNYNFYIFKLNFQLRTSLVYTKSSSETGTILLVTAVIFVLRTIVQLNTFDCSLAWAFQGINCVNQGYELQSVLQVWHVPGVEPWEDVHDNQPIGKWPGPSKVLEESGRPGQLFGNLKGLKYLWSQCVMKVSIHYSRLRWTYIMQVFVNFYL